MKRFVIPLLLAVLALVSCGPSVKDVRITSASVASVVPDGFNSFKLKAFIGVDNPGGRFSLKDVTATVNVSGRPTLFLSSPDVLVEGHTSTVYELPVSGRFAGNFNIFRLFSLGESLYGDDVTVDLKGKFVTSVGIGKNIDVKGIRLDKNMLAK